MRLDFELTSIDETAALGAALAQVLGAGDLLALEGDLGAGKTTLVRAIAAARAIDPGIVSSPTFVIVNQYPPARPGDAPLVHVDAYRLGSPEDLDPLGWDRLADGSSVLLIEWAERIAAALPQDRTARLALRSTGEHSRAASLEAPDEWSTRAAIEPLRSLAIPSREPTTCPVTGRHVPADSPTWPFADDRARMADLYRWFSGQYGMSRGVEESDLEETE
ncbi:MAG TPA: tRNA (adenosine(37)-N6)-threonylcarbamoyltransferase complex ATPase subunit type 1 TsaE [Phycisphaerales bacterium]|nr:tRNA (adenosine(37)-N6)-threonylcarbamoyltransferase complex ATPase subunit type 1 TsaE [Phycisphaerales bacterium]